MTLTTTAKLCVYRKSVSLDFATFCRSCRTLLRPNCFFNLSVQRTKSKITQQLGVYRNLPVIKSHRPNKHIMTDPKPVLLNKFKVFPWSISGLETCVVVHTDDAAFAFDMGYPFREAVKCEHIFVSHGHIDHVSGLVHHGAKRHLYNMKPATYFVPSALIKPLNKIAEGVAAMQDDPGAVNWVNLRPLDIGEEVRLSGGYLVKPFPTHHRVPSQGYIVYKERKRLKAEYKGSSGMEIGSLIREGVDVHDVQRTPMIAYTGDTRFDIYKDLYNPDLLKVKLLITEATYVDDDPHRSGRSSVEKARDRGHSHLQELADNVHLFDEVDDIVLIHFSDKYSPGFIQKRVDTILPEALWKKVHYSAPIINASLFKT